MLNRYRLIFGLFGLGLLYGGAVAVAAPLPEAKVPPALQPWIPWVLQEIPDYQCPHQAEDPQRRYCAWPGALKLQITQTGAEFSQAWRVFAKQYVTIPGGDNYWPQQVSLNERPVVVEERDGKPMVLLTAGEFKMSGQFVWPLLPQYIVLPAQTGLLELSIDASQVPYPKLATDGKLWIAQNRSVAVVAKTQDSLDLEVFRYIQDTIPLRMTTRLQLEVSGQGREISLGSMLPAGYIPLSLQTPLPARLDDQGMLQIQARPGRWTLDIVARAPGPVDAIHLPASNLPTSEIWVFEAQAPLRIAEVIGVPAIDPRQTRLPEEWQHLPTYQINPEGLFQLQTTQRGDPTPAPNRLSLQRELWLDFNGGGFTFKDHIEGEMHLGWRLNMGPEMQLGRVQVADIDQLITKDPSSGEQGVEVRQSGLQAQAAGRIEGAVRDLPALGWQQDFETVELQLNLPPGWRLLSVQGVDRIGGNSWVERWTLLDLFLVLIATLAARRLFSNAWAAAVFVCLVLTWHEADAPRYIWLNLLAVIGLLRVMPTGQARKWLDYYRYASLLLLALIALPYVVDKVRLSLYPQLEQPARISGQESYASAPMVEPSRPEPMLQEAPEGKADAEIITRFGSTDLPNPARRLKLKSSDSLDYDRSAMIQRVDPNAKVQTGPGLPGWTWNRSQLTFNGPVKQDQRIHLYVLAPSLAALFYVAGSLLILLLIWRLLDLKTGWRLALKLNSAAVSVAVAVLVFVTAPLAKVANAASVEAPFPDQELLLSLKQKLTASPDCVPHCAQISRLLAQTDDDKLRLTLEVHSSATVAVPIPGNDQQWMPERILLADRLLPVMKDASGQLQVLLEAGRHQIVLEGRLPPVAQFQVSLPLKPHYAQAQLKGWAVTGLNKDGTLENQLRFSRLDLTTLPDSQGLKQKPSQLPPFVLVERRLAFALEWRIQTRILRLSEPGIAIALSYPLLTGESVLTESVQVREKQAFIQMAAEQNEIYWESSLALSDQIQLTAATTLEWVEQWQLQVSPRWRVQTSGLVEVQHQDAAGHWNPQWRPWPGETLQIHLEKPEAVTGVTKTIDNSSLDVIPGQRISQYRLSVDIRSSQADQQVVQLPEGAALQKLSLDGQVQPIRGNDQELTIPLHPGKQTVLLEWQQSQGMAVGFRSVPINIETESVNTNVTLQVPDNRWVLLLGGPRLGPAVLIWGVMLVVLLLAFSLSRSKSSPLKMWQWVLLGIGLTQAYVIGVVLVIAWFYAMAWRSGKGEDLTREQFNAMQAGLAMLTILALAALLAAVAMGLLGYPDMQIVGNGSTAQTLHWYTDRSDAELPRVWLLSLPLWVYRVLMLIWSLWLAFAMLSWLKWAWQAYSSNGIWRPVDLVIVAAGNTKPKTLAAPGSDSD